ncbi:hypothetical protein SPOG_02568 [Schizosaccharomyces cryophilus OY26]|uniref:Distal membrane-arm assembly complex protein 1-like domain-containing protein n=1 Tax=Schizosaccharomyces cryophilus (strain OY26 / ATCC MYA-4695 / CBS 11777 / NBRC 106824 / NRRL Y48691) TaxID=653667 RepID=S9X2U0_SCHCR|nr:uncharacterized protein SPOG_02568 [Schizosaccharomyces cryophilus OY26]EPY51397.1 hypothetical protein SPOG_02568 [Schizosaccharomyces cryophilus OY26]
MSTSQPQSRINPNDPRFERYDCLPCRLIGATAFTGLGAYAYWQSRIPKSTPHYRTKRLGLLSLATGFISVGLYRLVN